MGQEDGFLRGRNVTKPRARARSAGGCGVVNVLQPMLKAEGSYRGAPNGGSATKSNLVMRFMRSN